jgi:serine/threonine protein kinase/WD40 repeat protein
MGEMNTAMTTPLPSNSAEGILIAALDHAPEDREAFLATACKDDATLLTEVRALLSAHEAMPTDFLAQPAVNDLHVTIKAAPGMRPPAPAMPIEREGERIGRYKLLQEIGEGGFGSVWMAEQMEPVSRRVALKIIKLGMDTKEVIARFEAERQALAMMDHPNIAKVLDAGATDQGRPFFVMELVKGMPITQYCDEAGLGTRERLALFGDVCSAINHAHQKGVIHRDIKPSNVMVTLHGDKPVAKVIDFGIAKATQSKLTDKTLFTRFEQFIGTPAYMSPEQAALSGLDVDTRSDIYALGILLYELLVGKPPFDAQTLASAGYEEMRRIIREVEPPRPSIRLGTMAAEERTVVAKSHHIAPEQVGRLVEPDLDWIVMKAIDKDRTRRYETANGLALDIRRFLSDEPVSATPPSTAYRFQKFARRHRAAIRVAASITLLLLGASIVSSWLAVQASRARAAAERQRQAAQTEALRANDAEKRETQQRLRAEAQKTIARQRAYAADMLLCQQALKSNNLREAHQLLDRQRPVDGEEDIRDWEWRWLWDASRSGALIEFEKQQKRVLQALYEDGGKSIVTYEGGGAVRRMNIDSRRSETLQEPDETSSHLALQSNSGLLCASQNRRWIAALENDKKGYVVRIWDLLKNTPPREVAVGEALVSAIAISPDGSTLVTYAPEQNAASVWDLAHPDSLMPRKIELRFTRRVLNVYGAVRFSPDGGTLAVGGVGGQVRLMNVSEKIEDWTDKGEFTIKVGRNQAISTLDFSPDGRLLACGCMFIDPRIFVMEIETGKEVGVLSGHTGFVAGLAFSPDGKSLASASADQTVKIWDTKTWNVRGTHLGHTDEVWSVSFSPDGETLISGGKDRRIEVWSTLHFTERAGSPVVGPPPQFAGSLHAAPGSKKFVSIVEGVVTPVGDAAQAAPPELGRNNIKAFWTAPDEIVALSQAPLEIKVWAPAANRVETFPLDVTASAWVVAHYLPLSRLLVTVVPDDKGEEANVIRWDVAARRKLSSHSFPISKLIARMPASFSQDGRRMAVPGWDSVTIYDIVNGTRETTMAAPSKAGIQGMALSPDGKQLAVAARDKPAIMIRDADTGRLLTTLLGHSLVITILEYSPDGTRLLSNTIGSEPVKVWSTASWKEVARLEPPPGVYYGAPQFTSDGAGILVSAYKFGTGPVGPRLFRAPSWEEIADMETRMASQDRER